jgi:transforming growth factor-beta-induced protein
LGLEAADLLSPEARPLLGTVLAYHVIPGQALTASELQDGQVLETLNEGETLSVSISDDKVCFIPSAPGASQACVLAADIVACNAVVHIIDTVRGRGKN